MIRPTRTRERVTLVLQDHFGDEWRLHMSRDCSQFIGRYRRLENFGPRSGLLHFLPDEQN